MTQQHSTATRLGPREKVTLMVITLYFMTALTLVALGRAVEDVLILVSGTAGAALVTVCAIGIGSTVRVNREAERAAIAALARITVQP